jgi:glutaredoxin
VDTATRDEKREITLFLKQNNMPISFPVITIDDNIMTGFNKEELDILLDE